MEIFLNFPEKYEIFWTILPPHITIFEMMLSEDVLK